MTSEHVQPTPPHQPSRILVVDDEPPIRQALQRALTLADYQADEAASGEEALARLVEIPYDLMILDLNMPGLQGSEVMIQAHEHYPQLLIIILTGHATLESAIEAVKSAAADYLLKPVSIQDILTTVSRALHKRVEEQEQQALLRAIGDAVDGLHSRTPPVPRDAAMPEPGAEDAPP